MLIQSLYHVQNTVMNLQRYRWFILFVLIMISLLTTSHGMLLADGPGGGGEGCPSC